MQRANRKKKDYLSNNIILFIIINFTIIFIVVSITIIIIIITIIIIIIIIMIIIIILTGVVSNNVYLYHIPFLSSPS